MHKSMEQINGPAKQLSTSTSPGSPLDEETILEDPNCFGHEELPNAAHARERVRDILRRRKFKFDDSNLSPTSTIRDSDSHPHSFQDEDSDSFESSPLFIHLAYGLAYTVGSALGYSPPSLDVCLAAFLVANSNGLTAGSRAWSKHSHRSRPSPLDTIETDKRKRSAGWWGVTSGPVPIINEKSLSLFWKVMNGVTWRNLHWLPHQVLVYEVRVSEGYGMRWSQDQGAIEGFASLHMADRPWKFRGFLEPMMENGHDLKWRHPIVPT